MMLYDAYEVQRAFLTSAASMATIGSGLLSNPALPMGYLGFGPVLASALEVFAHAASPRGKPAFGLKSVSVDGAAHEVEEATVLHKPFGNLLRFTRAGLPADAPRLLIVAPMSGHYATLLRGTVERMAQGAVVYITDWADAKMVPASCGRFDLDDYIDYLIDFIAHIGPGTHLMAVCQPSVPALAATAIMAARDDANRPASLTMMGGPVDTRQSPTSVNDVAMQRPLTWFEGNVIATVPLAYPGHGRRVYPGFLQLAGFMAMNLGSHLISHYSMFNHLVTGDGESADATKAFYDEYRAVSDMTSEFYLQTVEHVFQRHSLPKGELFHRGVRVDLGRIQDTALLAIEGERDDISGIGQTRAALTGATTLSETKKKYFLAEGVGHYGIFNGGKWRNQIAPVVEDWMARHAAGANRLKVVA